MKLWRRGNKESAQKGSKKYILYTVLFMAVVIGILLLLAYNLLWGFVCILLLLLTNIVRSVLKAFYGKNLEDDEHDKKEGNVIPLSPKDLYNSQKLLRYATAVLAFLSLMTTANGMSSFVFSEGWQAYLGSFGVQSILVVFSLLLCRFFVQITRLSWPAYVKKLSEYGLIIFFCAALIVSSIFSFSYIANNAYKDSWCSDSETIIQEFFLNEAYRLREENERRGKVLLNYIKSNAGEGLKDIIDGAKKEEVGKLNSDFERKVKSIESNFEEFREGELKLNKNDFSKACKDDPDKQELLENSYNGFEKDYNNLVSNYNDIINEITSWQGQTPDIDILERIENNKTEIDGNIGMLQKLGGTMEERWKTHLIKDDIDSIKSTFVTGCYELESKYDKLGKYVEELKDIANRIEKNSDKDDEFELNEIISKILLLGVGDSKEEGSKKEGSEKDENKKVEEIIREINGYILNYSSGEMVSGDGIEKAASLNEAILLYRDYFELKSMIDIFCKDDMSKTYQIGVKEGEDAVEEKKEGEEVEKEEYDGKQGVGERKEMEQNIYIVSEEEWKENRNRDFYTFYSCIKKLPNIKGIEEGVGKNGDDNIDNLETVHGGKGDNEADKTNETEEMMEYYGDKESASRDMENYSDIKVIKAAEILQRDLLGELTDFEKALNYFKYDFPVMAFFAAGVAVFLDFGAFFTGCFLYATEYFQTDREKVE